jgi:parallel beta-helix repeat protein
MCKGMRMRKSVTLLLILVFLLASSITTPLLVKAELKTIVVPDDYPTIQEAIDHSNAGDTVFVRAGKYTLTGLLSGLIIDKPISLIGENRENTILTKIPYKYEYCTIEISADNVTFSGFTVKEGRSNIMVSGSNCKIIDNKIINSYYVGIGIGGSNNVISGNEITGHPSRGISMSSSDSLITNNNIANNCAGITIDSCKNVTISQNNITKNGIGGGLALSWDGPFYIEENNITYNQGFGIQFGKGTNNATVYKNNIIANQYGFNLLNYITIPADFLGFGNQVYYNNIVNNGVNAKVEHTCIFTANVSEGEGNGTDVVSWDNGKVGNYWSDYLSKYPNATEVDNSGIGDAPYVIDENNKDRYPFFELLTFEPPEIAVLSPIAQTYNETSVPLVFTVSKLTNWTGYSLDGKEPITVTGNMTLTGLSNGSHNVTVYAKDLVDTENSETVWFNVAAPFPVVPVAVVIVAVVIAAGLLVHFKKRKR